MAETDRVPAGIDPKIYSSTAAGGLAGRDLAGITAFFDGLELLGPGLVPVGDWTAGGLPGGSYDLVGAGILGGVGRT